MNPAYAREAKEALLKMTPRERCLMQEYGRKIYLGHERREGWNGELPFYLFWCGHCEHFAKGYPNGHLEHRYLICSECGEHHDFVPWWAPISLLWQGIRNFGTKPSIKE
ncbi:MAG TPA: hypothetical protein VJJ02_02175 [Candidatus Paceibacterota bacterium]